LSSGVGAAFGSCAAGTSTAIATVSAMIDIGMKTPASAR
jgi:hypothetical protein